MSDERPSAPPVSSGTTRAVDRESTLTLLERARTGDQQALDHLLARHATPLTRWAHGRLPRWARDITDTDDLIQDVLLQTFRRLDLIDARGPGALQAYLRQAVLNRIRDELRRRGRRPLRIDLDDLQVDRKCSPLEEAIGRESTKRYLHALAALTPGEREAIIGRVEMGYSYEELADLLGKPGPDAARKTARRALVHLAKLMDRPA